MQNPLKLPQREQLKAECLGSSSKDFLKTKDLLLLFFH
ncbi:hypothetical protein EV03_0895 [Prochlorococcus marinus str. PAC1]|uniref:Uncharacterized protein n=1 Tax=Prochlorococcus marinus str. PAC1 TaxID=59924 RepID=A0A0A2C3Q7_PROMR|nr:hypothetical protein EV03_0895 [Prochlorococcus marinus str. PAC1]